MVLRKPGIIFRGRELLYEKCKKIKTIHVTCILPSPAVLQAHNNITAHLTKTNQLKLNGMAELDRCVLSVCWRRQPERGGRRRDGDLPAVFRRHQVLQGLAHITELAHGTAPQHGALQLLGLQLLLLRLDLLPQAAAAVTQVRQPPLQLRNLPLHRCEFHLHVTLLVLSPLHQSLVSPSLSQWNVYK